ncbi:hypothetical protein OEZ86_012514 [Tetradesmus obliquus]|nr:hypothetical protein OEZ86_012514 [Tetradesmus obliquus]
MDYEHIKGVFERLQSRFGWEPMTEAGLTIGVKLDGQSVTLEPGGQFELSGAPLTTLHQTCAEVNSHLYQSKTIGEELGIGFLGVGFDPKWSIEQIPVMPKDRYRLMKAYMPTVGTRGLDMMFRTCTIQVNLDFESEQDMIEKFRIGLALQPIAVALFANSPFVEGKPTGFLSTRGDVWTDVDAARTGNLPFVFEPDMSFEKYVDYAMDVPMYFVYRKGQYINALGQSWRDFMEGKLPALPGQRPTMGDWENHLTTIFPEVGMGQSSTDAAFVGIEIRKRIIVQVRMHAMRSGASIGDCENHLTTIFPEVRLKKFLEMRGADGGPWRMICALPALWVGLIYEPQAQAEALDLISSWSQDDRDYLRNEVPRLGLATPFKGGTVQDVALKVLAIAQGGLDRRGYDEGHFLKQLHVIAESGMSPASHLLQLYGSSWGHSVDPLFKEFMY